MGDKVELDPSSLGYIYLKTPPLRVEYGVANNSDGEPRSIIHLVYSPIELAAILPVLNRMVALDVLPSLFFEDKGGGITNISVLFALVDPGMTLLRKVKMDGPLEVATDVGLTLTYVLLFCADTLVESKVLEPTLKLFEKHKEIYIVISEERFLIRPKQIQVIILTEIGTVVPDF